MPSFEPEEINISPYEYVRECNYHEIQKLISVLVDKGHLDEFDIPSTKNMHDQNFHENMEIIANHRLMLTIEEEEFLINLANKFKFL